jgi:hypothetical protein
MAVRIFLQEKKLKSNKETEPAPKTFKSGEIVITHLNKQAEGNQIRELTKYQYLNSYFLELQLLNRLIPRCAKATYKKCKIVTMKEEMVSNTKMMEIF